MNARDILEYGQKHVRDAVADLPDDAWNHPGVTTRWSVRDVIAHLASFECYLEDALKSVAGSYDTPTLDAMRADHDGFNDAQVAARHKLSPVLVMEELEDAHIRVMDLVERLGTERLREPGTIPWYGSQYSLDDFIVYANYGHKREHCAQIALFRKRAGK